MTSYPRGGIEAVIFDWGGTLSDYAAVELADMWRLAARHLAEHTAFGEDELMARLAGFEQAFWDTTSTHQRSATLGALLRSASEELGLDVAEAVLEEAAVRYLDSWTPHIVHDPDAAPVLEALRERGLRIGLLSNTHWPRPFHERFLERDGLDRLIDARLYTSEMRYQKPHPEAFAAALDALDVRDPARAVFVGDRLFDDIAGARRAGMRAVLRYNSKVPGYEVQPDAIIDRLPELLELVERWGTGDRIAPHEETRR